MKRKERDVEGGEMSPKKPKGSGFIEGIDNDKAGNTMRVLKGLLQKEQTRLSGLAKLLKLLKESENKETFEEIIKEGREFKEVFKILEGGRQSVSQLETQKCLEILERILLFTSEQKHLTSTTGIGIVQNVVQNHMRVLYKCLNSGNPSELIIAALKLLTAMVAQGVSSAREVQGSFDFTLQAIGFLPAKRDSKETPDVRTCFIHFGLSFLMFGDLTVMKEVLELQGFLQSIMKGLQFDSPNVVHAVLSTLQTRVVKNAGLTKKTKVKFFNSYVLSQLAGLYQYNEVAEEGSGQSVRQRVHELLLKICTSFKFGICFFNSVGAFATRSNNPVLLRFLQKLSSMTSDVLVQELVTKVLSCCHDLVNPFLWGLSAACEPRLSMFWVANINLVIKIFVALPQPSQMITKAGMNIENVEMLQSLVKMVIPVSISRSVLSRGVQHSNYLVKHLTLSLLVVIFDRAQNAVTFLATKSGGTLELDGANVQSENSLLQQFREEVLRGLCDINTVISLRQNLLVGTAKRETQEDVTSPSILHAQSLKVILGFQTLQPSIFSHINFDLKKLLPELDSTPIVQQLTLQILLQAPPGSLKWHQQKGKSSTSFVYSVLTLHTFATTGNVKDKAKQLLWKLISESGVVSNNANEVDIWLNQLDHYQGDKGTMQARLVFLDEVFTAVTKEPHAHADDVIDAQAEVAASEASLEECGVDSRWNVTSNTSLPVSLLLVGALKRYSEMVCEKVKPVDETDAGNKGCIARYLNGVIFDLIHCSVYPTLVSFVVCRCYSNIVIPDHLAATVSSVHEAVLCYAGQWLPRATKEKFGSFKEYPQRSDEHVNKLSTFLDKTVVKTEEEKVTATAELYHLLEALDRVQLSSVMDDCVHFCMQKLSADFSPLVEILRVRNYIINGIALSESMAPLLHSLPFTVLVWQVFGDSIEDVDVSVHSTQRGTSSLDKTTSNILCSSWIQELFIAALEKEPESKTISHCRHLLLYLHSLKTRLTTVSDSIEQERQKSATLSCFQLIQHLMQRSLSVQLSSDKDNTNILDEKSNNPLGTNPSAMGVCKADSCFAEDICRAVLRHPVVLDCFLWNPEISISQAICKDVGSRLTYTIANLLLAVQSSLPLQEKQVLMAPFVKKLCQEGLSEVQFAVKGCETSSSEALFLVALFNDYFDNDSRTLFISSLSELPSHKLVRNDHSSGEAAPSAFLLTLLSLLESGFSSLEERSPSPPSFLRNSDLKAGEPLPLAHFERLVEISQEVNCPQLDRAILKLLQSSLVYVLASTTSLLDGCLNHPTENKVAIALHLVVNSTALRSHFERRCLVKPKTNETIAVEESAETWPIEFKSHLTEFLPLVCSYLLCFHGMDLRAPGHTRAREVNSLLVEVYWDPLWEWLFDNTETILKNSQDQCMEMFFALIQTTERDDHLKKKFQALLSIASSWNVCRFRICDQLLTRLCYGCSLNEKTAFMSKFCFASMGFLSSVLEGKVGKKIDEDVFDDFLARLDLLCEESTGLSVSDDIGVAEWNSFVTNTLRYKLESANVLRTLRWIIRALYKDQGGDKSPLASFLSLDTLYEMILSHSQFLDVILCDEHGGKMETKEALIELLSTVVERGASCCKSAHLPVLFAAYSATMSSTDQSILYLLNLYEKNHASFKNYSPMLWGQAAASHHQIVKSLGPSLWKQPTVIEILEQLDATAVRKAAVLFPQSRLLQPQVQRELCNRKLSDAFDPCFLLPLFSCLLAPNSQVDCRKFVEQGCLSFTVASLSSRDTHMRQAGYHVLTRFMTHLEGAHFKESKQIFHLLKYLKNGITEANCRLSSVMACFVSRMADILLKPEHPFYVTMNSFLLQRPSLQLRDLPLFYSMFNSGTMEHMTERSWMLQLLVDGMKDNPDYYLYKRRQVFELTLSYHNSPVSDQHSQNLVTELLLSALKMRPAAYDLAKNFGVAAWIHSLCHKSPERMSTSLNLLDTLWFTLHQGDRDSYKDGMDEDENVKVVRLPPTVAQESALVCWTLLEHLGKRPVVRDTCKFFQLLSSIIFYLASNQQLLGLSHGRILNLLHLWCIAFDETPTLNELLSSLSLSKVCSREEAPPCIDIDWSKLKKDSLSDLLSILTLWEPSPSSETDKTVLLVWRFGFCSYRASAGDEIACLRSSNHEGRTPVHLLSLLRWFRNCLVRSRTLQVRLASDNSARDLKVMLQLYQTGLSGGKTSSRHVGVRASQINSSLAATREINMICLVLLAAVQRLKRLNDARESVVCQLISREPYAECITRGLEKVVFPLLPDPRNDFKEESCEDQVIELHGLLALFMQELWTGRPIPRHFLSLLSSQGRSGNPVTEALVTALGGTNVISTWLRKEDN
ncbi:nucleolar pre-ribosomal-associated protein 1-like isoform X2 [Montipora capricornis]|uniref:nucleolar pre-ribosomal-associated protein 1-like isoform X2 n=1 Tax=Montipora capricornis TaxID=246305 RepID=UPI0035F20F59